MNFTYNSLPHRVLFGAAMLSKVRAEAEQLGGTRALVLCTPQQTRLAEEVAALLGDLCVGVYNQAVMHVPVETVADALKVVQERDVDLLVTPGGGSTIGLGKGLALETGLPILAIPTTYAGSEMTHIWGLTEGGRKKTGRNPVVKPKSVIYDPLLVMSLPVGMSVTSAINAIAHSVEALYAQNANPITSIMAEESIRALASGLPNVVQNPNDLVARSQTFYGSWLAATVLGSVGMALHHKLCHTLGGSYNMPHAQTHTVVLPYATAYNSSHAPKAMQAIARALDCDIDDVAGSIYDLSHKHGGPVSLKELGFREEDIEDAAHIATQNPYYNPRPVTLEGIRDVFTKAYHGERP